MRSGGSGHTFTSVVTGSAVPSGTHPGRIGNVSLYGGVMGDPAMRLSAVLLLAAACTLAALSGPAQAQKRMALLIGNKDYKQAVGPLRNPHNDLGIVGNALGKAGFEVFQVLKDARREEILLAVHDFAEKLKDAGTDAIGFLYYSGHGVASAGQNYLIPVDVEQPSSRILAVKGVTHTEILNKLQEIAPQAAHYLVLDACRSNLGGWRGSKGFVAVQQRAGVFIAFAAQPEGTASDEGDDGGPYATALAAELGKPEQSDHGLFHNVRIAVMSKTRSEQVPWFEDGIARPKRPQFGVAMAKPPEPLPPETGPATGPVSRRAPEVECDRLAAHPNDPDAVARGVTIEQMDARRAVRVCELVKSQYPAEKRFAYQLARAYGARGDHARAKDLLEGLAAEGYVAAFFSLADLYLGGGWGVTKDRTVGLGWLRRGAESEHVPAMVRLGQELLLGDEAKERGEAIAWLRKGAEKRDLRAMMLLGLALIEGTDATEEHRTEGAGWISKAAQAEDGLAMYLLGTLYQAGNGVARDLGKAAHWFERGALSGDATAMEAFGLVLLRGQGIAKDELKAADWLRKAAGAGRWHAMLHLGHLYRDGKGVPKDSAEAFRRYREAAEITIQNGETEAICVLAGSYLSGKEVAKDLREAAKWFARAADGGCASSMVNLGFMHVEGTGGLPKDSAKAEAWFRKATEIDPTAVGCPFADAYLRGKSPANLAQPIIWFTKAAEAGCPYSMYSLGLIHAEARQGLSKDDAKAEDWFRRARTGLAQHEDDDTAMVMLADMNRHGRGGPKNEQEAFAWALKSAERSHTVGMVIVGEMYESGSGVAKNEGEAVAWYRKAESQANQGGAEPAMLHLGRLHAEGRNVDKSEATAREMFRKATRTASVEQVWGKAVWLANTPEFGLLRPPYETATLMLLTLAETSKYREQMIANAGNLPAPVRVAVQRKLKSAGHFRGTVNGTFGADTKTALEAWAASQQTPGRRAGQQR